MIRIKMMKEGEVLNLYNGTVLIREEGQTAQYVHFSKLDDPDDVVHLWEDTPIHRVKYGFKMGTLEEEEKLRTC